MLNISEDKRFMRSFKICLPSHCAPGVNWDHRCRFRTLYGPTLLSILTCTDVHNSCPLILCGFLTQKDRQTIIFRLGLVKFKLTTVGLRLPLFLRVSLIWATESIQLDVCLRSLWTCLGQEKRKHHSAEQEVSAATKKGTGTKPSQLTRQSKDSWKPGWHVLYL